MYVMKRKLACCTAAKKNIKQWSTNNSALHFISVNFVNVRSVRYKNGHEEIQIKEIKEMECKKKD